MVALKVFGHEIAHLVDWNDLKTVGELRTARRVFYAMSPEDRGEMAKRFLMVFVPEQQLTELGPYILNRAAEAAGSPAELMADLLGLAAVGAAHPMSKAAIDRFMVDSSLYEAHFLRQAAMPILDLYRGVTKLFELDDVMHLTLGERGGLVTAKEVYQRVAENIGQMVQVANKTISAGESFAVMASNEPDKMREKLPAMAEVVFDKVFPGPTGRHWATQVGWYWRNLAPSAQLAAKYPKLGGVFNTIFSFHPFANSFAMKVIEPLVTVSKGLFGFGKQVAFDEKLTGLRYLLTHPNAEKAASEVALAEQSLERLMTPAEIQSFLSGKGYSPEVIDVVTRWEKAATTMMTNMASQIVRVHEELARLRVATVLMHENQALDVATAKASAVEVMQGNVPAGLNAKAALEVAADMKQALEKLASTLQGRPWFRTEMRLGRYMVSWKEPITGQPGTFASDSREVIDAYVEKLKQKGATNIVAWDKYDRRGTFSGLHPDFVQSMSVIEESAYANRIAEIAKKHGLSQEVVEDLMNTYVPLAAVTKELSEAGFEKFMIQRKLSPGREELNMVQGTLHYVQAMAKVLAKKVVGAQFALEMANLRGEDALKKIARDHFQAVVNPTSSEWTGFKNATFFYYLAFAPSQMVIEATQGLSTVVPQLTRDTGDVMASYRYLNEGLRLVFERVKHQKTFGNAELDAAFKKAVEEQVIDFGAMQEIYDAEALARINLSAALNGKPLADATYFAKSALQWTFRYARDVYAMMPRLNSMMTFMAAYKLAREHGVLVNGKITKLGPEEAYEYAKMTNRRTLFGGGVAARPVGLFANKGGLQGMIGAMYSLSSFTASTIAMYARLASDSVGKLPTAERAAARKALAQMLVSQGFLAGTLGLPFAGAFLAVADQLFPEQEVSRKLEEKTREAFEAILGDQAADFMADMALRGFPAAGLGVDLSSRLELSNLLGINPYDGFNLQNFLGPGANMVGNMMKAVVEAGKGEVGQAVRTLVPSPIKNAVNLVIGGGDVRDQAGRPILADMTPEEKFLYVLGFRPTRLAKAQLAIRLSKKHEQVAGDQLARFHQELAEMLLRTGRSDLVIGEVWKKFGESGGLYNPEEGLRTVAEKATSMLFQFDPSRLGTVLSRPTRARLAEMARLQVPDPLTRFLKQKELEALLGLPARRLISSSSLARLWQAPVEQP
jgi:hypothetical protein